MRCQSIVFLSCAKISDRKKIILPAGEIILPAGKIILPTGEIILPAGELILRAGELIFLSDSKTFEKWTLKVRAFLKVHLHTFLAIYSKWDFIIIILIIA
jgi:hypothetical protein